jgi:hypothetical protein
LKDALLVVAKVNTPAILNRKEVIDLFRYKATRLGKDF